MIQCASLFNRPLPSSRMSYDATLQLLSSSLDDLTFNRMSVTDFCRTWRTQAALLPPLPARFMAVLEDILGRLETSSLFTEESCSFSQKDLQESLAIWLDKAQQAVTKA